MWRKKIEIAVIIRQILSYNHAFKLPNISYKQYINEAVKRCQVIATTTEMESVHSGPGRSPYVHNKVV